MGRTVSKAHEKVANHYFQWNYLLTFLLFLLVVVGLVAFSPERLYQRSGESRIDLLNQVAERGKIINKARFRWPMPFITMLLADLLDSDETTSQQTYNKVDAIVA
jgi:hypothetical protein